MVNETIDLEAFGVEAFDYFPAEFLIEVAPLAYEKHCSTLHTENPWDTSKVNPGMKVKTSDSQKGIVTSYHLTEIGQANGGVEVDIDGKLHYYYPHQLTIDIHAR